MRGDSTDAPPGGRRRGPAVVVLVLAAALLHIGLLTALEPTRPASSASAPRAPALRVRTVIAEAVATPSPLPVAPLIADRARPTSPAVRAARVDRVAPPSTRGPQPATSQVGAAPAPGPVAPAMSIEPLATSASAQATEAVKVSVESPAGDEANEPVPVYPTHPPPAVRLRYDLQRGNSSGSAELRWRPDRDEQNGVADNGYHLQFDCWLGVTEVLGQTSEGELEAIGLAPLRFTERRLRRALQAVNFQHEASRITFSGPSSELPLSPGVQDRLSWMIQLPAVVAADTNLLLPGAEVVLRVVGARAGDAVWVLRHTGRVSVETAIGTVLADKFLREPLGIYDTRVEVWLDPLRFHLPVRAKWRNGADGETFELTLRELIAGPSGG